MLTVLPHPPDFTTQKWYYVISADKNGSKVVMVKVGWLEGLVLYFHGLQRRTHRVQNSSKAEERIKK